MVAQITEKAYFLRSELIAMREIERSIPPRVSRIPSLKNAIPNGGFDSGVVGWDIADAATTTRSVVSGSIQITAGGARRASILKR